MSRLIAKLTLLIEFKKSELRFEVVQDHAFYFTR
jgi:hypothetical protein